ncbi:MFS transporter [Streptomyces sp. NPDC006368]|uniref:MFS transporter n=1 Tax=Streptomyces sp. NPDC006368 TaxID=3156760 RepID=UPI0033AAA768
MTSLSKTASGHPAPRGEATVRGRPFRLLWGGQTVSVLGDGIALLALPLLVLDHSGGPVLVALAAAPQPVAYALAGLLAGPLVDRLDVRRTMVVCDCARAALFALLTWLVWTGQGQIWSVLGLAVLAAVFGVIFDTAHAALVQELLDEDNLVAGSSRLEVSSQTGLLLGPVLAGLLTALVGLEACLLANTVSYAASIAAVVAISGRRRGTAQAVGLSWETVRTDLKQGLRHLWSHRLIRSVSGLQMIINFAVAVEALIVFFAARTLHGSSSAVSFVVCTAAVGGIAGAAVAEMAGRRWDSLKIIPAAVLALGCALVLAATATRIAWLAAANLAVGLATVLCTVHIRALRLRIVPPEFIGRVTSAARTAAVIAYPLGVLLAGALTEALHNDPRYAFAAAGVLMAGCALTAHRVLGRTAARGSSASPIPGQPS